MAARIRSLVALSALLLMVALVVAAPIAAAGPAEARGTPWPGHPDRRIVLHVVRPGDTATGLAVRYHAWTRELVALNGLGPEALLQVGETVRIPVVVSAARRHAQHQPAPQAGDQHPTQHPTQHPIQHPTQLTTRHPARDAVRRAIGREARRRGVPVRLAQAVGWQESGWQQQVRSPAGAIGVMQVLPDTGLWMSLYAHRPLDLRTTRDNITAGVTLLRVLLDETRSTRRAIGAYYQGLAGVRRYGLYRETRQYVADVLAVRDRL